MLLQRGDEISSALLEAIEDSKLSVIVFSENYASSSWCLDELVHILRYKKRDKQIVVPIFYHVNPCHVRKQTGSFGVVFRELEQRFKSNSDGLTQWRTVLISTISKMIGYVDGSVEERCRSHESDRLSQWRTALTSAANLSGWDAPPTGCDESELIDKIVNDILKKLNFVSSSIEVLNDLVGMERRIENLESLFQTKSSLDAQIVGILAMDGMGKTTLAHALFTRIYNRFEGHCFLENAREEWKHNRLKLRETLYAELLEERHQDIVNMFAKERLSRKKVLIVLDDLSDVEQFEYLVGDRNWLRHGSRVIITTRNKQMLNNIGVDWIYMAEQLDDDEALQLFSLKAFQRDSPPKKYMDLSKEVVNYAAGMPLALKVLGSHLNSKSEEEWKSALVKLKQFLDGKIQGILKMSYDGLDYHERDAFLDIACFFKGNRIAFVEEILGGCGFKDTIRNLINNSLISITHENKVWMHNLVQQMGWEIVRQKNPKKLGKRSRLWITNEVCHVLLRDLGTSSIEGLSLNTSHMKYDMDIKPTAFNKMYNLRLLRISVCMGNYKLSVSGGLDFLPDALRYLEWAQYPLKSLPSSFIPHNLVNLDMPLGQFEHLWNGLQHVESLQYVSLCFSKKLSNIPNLSRANLKCADFEGCTSLVESKREDLLRYGPLQGLKVHDYSLNLNGCSNFKTLSHLSGGIEYIYLRSTETEELHHSIWSLGHLALLDLNNCKNLKNLPEDICNLECMKELNLGGCVCINMFPKLPRNIVRVDLSGTAIEQVPSSSFDYCTSLEVLCLKDCTRLEYVSTAISKLKLLNHLDLSYCSKLKCFPNITEPMEHLVHLHLDGSGIEEIQYWSIRTFIGLRMLNLS
ncbi:disease resistance protein RPV1-like [Humulus lupulus]|uniref:disease resistance protein RPV1-like n=1 Tax=Humulus lupulus TaxID=3486 RepID=UPI002B40387E|nr:disease resistance protein RPV1-like [Humulus lupulus]